MALFNRKNKEDKKKNGENIVGKIIYIFLLFAPLFSILTTSLYTIFNKNAFESYYGETINESTNVTQSFNELRSNETYYVSYSPLTNSKDVTDDNIGGSNYYTSITNVEIISNSTGLDLSEITKFFYYKVASENYVRLYYSLNNGPATPLTKNNTLEFKFTLTGSNYNENVYNLLPYYKVVYNKYSYLDNNFDYGIYKTEQNNLFNWAKNTGTYTIMKTTTEGLEINNTFIPMLLTYWLIISVIYFIYDIALMLIWILHRKIHELTESV